MKLCYPMEYVNITQGSYGTFSHTNKKAIDLGGADIYKCPIFAPCDNFKIIGIYDNYVMGEIDLSDSEEKIELLSGESCDYLKIMFYHETAFEFVTVRDVLDRKEIFMQEGTKGNADGNHIHIQVWLDKEGEVDIEPELVFWLFPNINEIKSVDNAYYQPLWNEYYSVDSGNELDEDEANLLIGLLKSIYSIIDENKGESTYAKDKVHSLANKLRVLSGQDIE